jgi:hypothetical protein
MHLLYSKRWYAELIAVAFSSRKMVSVLAVSTGDGQSVLCLVEVESTCLMSPRVSSIDSAITFNEVFPAANAVGLLLRNYQYPGWDADRLDPAPVGITPNAKYLGTAAARTETFMNKADRHTQAFDVYDVRHDSN